MLGYRVGYLQGSKKGRYTLASTQVQKLLIAEIQARKAWYATHAGGTPKRPFTPVQRAALRALEKAKAALVAGVGAANFKEAARALSYSPVYAPRKRAL